MKDLDELGQNAGGSVKEEQLWHCTYVAVVGYHKIEIFRHVPQSTLMSAEPGMERRWAKIRMDASTLLSFA